MWGISGPGRAGAGVRGGRRAACPTCLGRASGLEAGEPAVEGAGFRGRGGVRREAGASSGLPEGSGDGGRGTVESHRTHPRGCGAEGVWGEKLG